MNQIAFAEAEAMFQRLETDPRMKTVKHFRDKYTAHSAHPAPGMRPPNYGEMFAFSKEVATAMEKFAIGVGVTTELLADTEDWRIDATPRSFGSRGNFSGGADVYDGALRLPDRAGHTHAHLRVEFNLDKAVLSIRLRALSSTYCKASSTCEVRLLSSVALSMAANFDASSF
jgi:hypothetical protein